MRAAGPVRASQGSDARVSLLRALANACLALLAVLALVANPGGAGLLLAVASLLLLAYQGYGSLLQRNQHLERLYDFTRAVTRSQEVEEIVRALLEQSSGLLRAERAELLLDDSAPGASRLVRLAGGQGGSVEARPVDEAGRLFQVPEGTVAVHPRPIRDPSLRGEAAEQGLRDAVTAILPGHGKPLGALLVGNRLGEAGTFDAEDGRLLEALANQAAVALEKARLIGRLRMEVAERRIQALYDRLTGLGNRRWFLEELASAIAARPGAGLDLGVAVNLSARGLLADRLVEEVAGLLAALGLPASALTLEVTEGQVMTDFEQAVRALGQLSDLGVHLAVDDFGTGYSSLGYLRELPVDEMKIDQSFVVGMASDAGDQAIVEAAVTLGHSLGLRVVAEGVDDAETHRRLAAMGCDLLQGFHIGRPMPPDELLECALGAERALGADRVPSEQRR